WRLKGSNSGCSRHVTAQSLHLHSSAAAARRPPPDRPGGTDMAGPATPTGRREGGTAMPRMRMGLLLGLLLALAACSGGGGKPGGVASLGDGKATSTTSAGGSQDERQADLAYARCM